MTIKCSDFAKARLFLRAEGTRVWAHYGLEGVPETGYYVVRFWPTGRHKGRNYDHPIGMINKGEDRRGDTDSWEMEGITGPTTLHFNLDLDAWKSEEAYRRGSIDEHLGQCDRGAEIELRPPVDPPDKHVARKAECHELVNEAGEPIYRKTVWEGDPEYGHAHRRMKVTPGQCS